MKSTKKMVSVLVLVFLFGATLPLLVSANAPVPADYLTVVISDMPEEAVYADLLIKIDEKDPNYVGFQPNSFADTASDVIEIVDYLDEGYRSFTFHYKNAKSNIKLDYYYNDSYYVSFCQGSEYQRYLTQYEDLRENYRDIKIVLLDKDYKIITVSEAGVLPKESNFHTFYGDIYYSASDDDLIIEQRFNPYAALFTIIVSGIIMLLSIGTELIISLIFKFKRKQLATILLVNTCTQLAMRILYLILPFTYLLETIILELLVYSGEFLIYKKYFRQATVKKVLIYTVFANTVSLLIGITFDLHLLA